MEFFKLKKEKNSLPQQEQESFMKRAIELSEVGMESNEGGPFGAVIVNNGRIVGEGFNQVTSLNDPTAHAEIIAIREACHNLSTFDLADCIIFTSCEPCPMCLAAIYWANIDEIFYANTKEDANNIGFRDYFIYNEFNKPINKRKKKFTQLLNKEAKQVFCNWALKTDKVEY